MFRIFADLSAPIISKTRMFTVPAWIDSKFIVRCRNKKSMHIWLFLWKIRDFWLLKFFDEIFSGWPFGPPEKISYNIPDTKKQQGLLSSPPQSTETPSGGIFLTIEDIYRTLWCQIWGAFNNTFRGFGQCLMLWRLSGTLILGSIGKKLCADKDESQLRIEVLFVRVFNVLEYTQETLSNHSN